MCLLSQKVVSADLPLLSRLLPSGMFPIAQQTQFDCWHFVFEHCPSVLAKQVDRTARSLLQ